MLCRDTDRRLLDRIPHYLSIQIPEASSKLVKLTRHLQLHARDGMLGWRVGGSSILWEIVCLNNPQSSTLVNKNVYLCICVLSRYLKIFDDRLPQQSNRVHSV